MWDFYAYICYCFSNRKCLKIAYYQDYFQDTKSTYCKDVSCYFPLTFRFLIVREKMLIRIVENILLCPTFINNGNNRIFWRQKMNTLDSIAIQYKSRYDYDIEKHVTVTVKSKTNLGEIVELSKSVPCNKKKTHIFLIPNDGFLDEGIPERFDQQLQIDLNLISLFDDRVRQNHRDSRGRFRKPFINVTKYEPEKNLIHADISEQEFCAEQSYISQYLRTAFNYAPFKEDNIVNTYIEYLNAIMSVKKLASNKDRNIIGRILCSNFGMIRRVAKTNIDNAESAKIPVESQIKPTNITHLINTSKPPFDNGQIILSNLLHLIYHSDFRNYFAFPHLPDTLCFDDCLIKICV